MVSKYPDLTHVTAAPNQQVFDMDTVQLTLETGLLKVVGRGQDALEQVTTIAGSFYSVVVQHLNLSSFTRAGFRLITSKAFANSEEAMAFAHDVGLVSLDAPKALGKKVGFSTIHRFETETSGLWANARVEEKTLNIGIPWDGRSLLQPVKSKKMVLFVDTDYYTVGLIDRETLDVATWLGQANRVIRRYWENL